METHSTEAREAEMEAPASPSLAALLLAQRTLEAIVFLRHADSEQLKVEISLAFEASPSAPSELLACATLFASSCKRDPGSRLAQWFEPAVICMTPQLRAQLSSADRAQATALLPALESCRASLVAAFVRAFGVDNDAVLAFCSRLVLSKVYTAVLLLDTLRLKNGLPAALVIEEAINQNDLRAADLFVKGSKSDQTLFVQRLVDRNISDKIVKKRLSTFKLEPSAFPEYLKRKQIGALRYLLHQEQYDEALTFVQQASELKSYACQMLIRKRGPNNPATRQFVFRTGLAAQFPEVDTRGEADREFEDDADLAPLASCLSLDDTIGEANIVFVDTLEALRECAAHLVAQPVVGFDSEWKTVHIDAATGRTSSFCATLQLASLEKAFVIDVLKLGAQGDALQPVFSSEQVLVLGFDTRGDVGAIRSFVAVSEVGPIIARLADIQVIARKLLMDATGGKDSKQAHNGSTAQVVEASLTNTARAQQTQGEASAPREGDKRRRNKKRGQSGGKTSFGLTNVAETYLGRPLDKRLTVSDWAKRPLTPAQLRYAALDAHVLVQIYAKMQESHPREKFDAVMSRCTQKNVQ